MPSKQSFYLLTVAGLGTLLAAPAFAQDSGYTYGGIGVGKSKANLHAETVSTSLLGTGLASSVTSRDESDTGYKLFMGYQMSPRWALEAGAFKLGDFNFNSSTTPAGTLHGNARAWGLNMDLVGNAPMTERLSFIGRIGAAATRMTSNYSTTGAAFTVPGKSGRETKIDAKVGLGLQYAFTPNVAMRAEVERYRMTDAAAIRMPVTTTMLSLVWRFGSAPAPVRAAPVQTTYVAPPPPPAPEVMPPPPPPPPPMPAPPPPPVVLKQVSFSAESLFGFDKSALRTDAKVALDTFSSELRGTRYDRIDVTGHTDRIGTEAYNDKLSQERADTVRSYLIQNGGVDARKIVATGKGERSPMTAPGDCKGNAPTQKLKDCLQPDRRVDVVVTGQR